MARSDVPAAAAAMERALLENAGMYAARARLGELRLMQRRPADAVEEFRQAVELAPDDGYLRYQYGAALQSMGRHAEAVEQLRQAARLEPHYAQVYVALGGVLEASGERGDALAAWRRFAELAPRSSAAALSRARQRIAALEQAQE